MQHLDKQSYGKLVEQYAPPSALGKDCRNAFWIGGLICVVGQLISDGWTLLGLGQEDAGTATSITLIFISALLTGCHLYDKLGKFAGAGSLVPITGFANSVVSPAIEFKSEGFVTGMAVKIFNIAGPVIVYGVGASVLYGVIYYLWQLLA